MQSPNNGIYRSTTGEPGSFIKLATSGFTPPTNRSPSHTTTGHPDQQDGLWVPASHDLGGVTLIVGNDGGFYKQHAPFGPIDQRQSDFIAAV